MMLETGTKLGPYEILSALGAGGIGEVYGARGTKLQRDVALKILPDAMARGAHRMAINGKLTGKDRGGTLPTDWSVYGSSGRMIQHTDLFSSSPYWFSIVFQNRLK